MNRIDMIEKSKTKKKKKKKIITAIHFRAGVITIY
jgi:hypothetical protein